MIVIADSGSTKTDWTIMKDNSLSKAQTIGMNPVLQTEQQLEMALSNAPFQLDEDAEIFFYGSGCAEDGPAKIQRCIASVFHFTRVENIHVYSDLLGAARALLGNSRGMACILGTGSNSCLYDGKEIVKNVHSLGFILGDEGSGAVLGKTLLNALYKGKLKEETRLCFERETGLDYPTIIRKVYSEPFPSRFLGSLTHFISAHIEDDAELEEIVVRNFRNFIVNNLLQYDMHTVNAVGSIAYYFRKQLEEACEEEGFTMGNILKSPMEGLISYHSKA